MVGEAILSTSFYKTKWNPIPKLYKDSVEKKITDQTHLLKWMKTENKQTKNAQVKYSKHNPVIKK